MKYDIDRIDHAIGRIIRDRRTKAGKPMSYLADKTGLSTQQIQKYETGVNRVPVGQLVVIARALKADAGHIIGQAVKDAGKEQANV